MKISKKLYPWLPLVGIFLVFKEPFQSFEELGMDNTFVFLGSAFVQAVAISSILIGVAS